MCCNACRLCGSHASFGLLFFELMLPYVVLGQSLERFFHLPHLLPFVARRPNHRTNAHHRGSGGRSCAVIELPTALGQIKLSHPSACPDAIWPQCRSSFLSSPDVDPDPWASLAPFEIVRHMLRSKSHHCTKDFNNVTLEWRVGTKPLPTESAVSH